MGGTHHCLVARPEEELDASRLTIEGGQPYNSEVFEWFHNNTDKFVYPDERGLHYLLWRLIDNAVDEAKGGYATAVTVRILDDRGVEVSDNGHGIAAGQPDPFLSTAHKIVAALPREGDDTSDARFGRFGGTRAAGSWIVNALSTRMTIESTHADEHWIQRYTNSRPSGFEVPEAAAAAGTTVRFWASREVFSEAVFDFEVVARHVHQLALLNNGATFEVVDERVAPEPRSRSFCFTDGLVGYVQRRIVRYRTPLHDGVIHFVGCRLTGDIEIAMQWLHSHTEQIHTFVDNIDTSGDLGSHERGFRTGVNKVVNNYVRARKLLRDTEPNLDDSDVCAGLAAVVTVRATETPVFEDSTRTQLIDPHLELAVQRLCEHRLGRWFDDNPAAADVIARNAVAVADASRMPRRSHCYEQPAYRLG